MSSCSLRWASDFVMIFDVLRTCSQLEQLELHIVEVNVHYGVPQITEPIFLPRMRSLTVIETDSIIVGPLISLLHADTLETLKVEKTGLRPPDHIHAIKQALLDSPLPPPCLLSMLENPILQVKSLKIMIQQCVLTIDGDFPDEKGEISIYLEQAQTHWLHELGQLSNLSLASGGVPLHVEIFDLHRRHGLRNVAETTAFLTPLSTMTSLRVCCSPRLALPTIRALCKSSGSWLCPKLAELHIGLGNRAAWREHDWLWKGIIAALNSVRMERNSAEARDAGVEIIVLYQYEFGGASRLVEDIGALFLKETSAEEASASTTD